MAIGVTRGLLDWKFQENYVERVMDNAAYSAAHPDDTLVLAGPARLASVNTTSAQDSVDASTGIIGIYAIGMLQQVQFTQSKPTQPMMAIGSGRSFFVSGKAQTQWSVGRLFVNGKNLLRALYHNAALGKVPVDKLDDIAASASTSNFYTNLDSELYYIPFGMACLFRNKAHDVIGSFYAELCMINSYSIGMNAGQTMMMENVSGVADRILPFNSDATGQYAVSGYKWPRATVDAVLSFTSSNKSQPGSDINADVDNDA